MIELKNIIKTGFIAFMLTVFSFALSAQDRECDVYVSNNPVGNGVSVRWIGKQISYQEGISIYRKDKNSDWKLITPSPIMPPKSQDNSIQLSQKGQEMYNVYAGQSLEEFLDGFGGIFTVIESVKEYNLALALHIAYNDVTAVNGKEYQYRIETKLKGKTTVLGITNPIVCQPFTPVSMPDSITVVRKKRGIAIDWINNIDKYYAFDVYQKIEEGEWVKLTDYLSSTAIKGSKKSKVYRKASPDTSYTYKVCGYDYFGKQSEMSPEFVMEIQDFVPPIIPIVYIKVDSKKMAVRLSWSQNVDKDLSHYNIYRSLDPENFIEPKINRENIPKTDTVYIDYPELAGSYFYRVEAVDLSGNSSKSLYINGTVYDIRPPVAPRNLISRVDTGKLYLNWDANKDVDLKGYRLFRSVADEDNSDNKFVVVNTAVIDTNFYMEPMSKNVRDVFVYHVRALDSSYNVGKPSNEVLAQLPDVVAPKAPFIKRAYEINDTMQIEWMPNVEKDLKSYNIYKRKKCDTTDFEQLNISPIPKNISVYSDPAAIRGQFYEYYLVAEDISNLKSPISNTALGKLEFIPLSGSLIIKKYKISKLKQEFIIEWSLDSLFNEPIMGYSIHKSFNGAKARQMGSVIDKLIYKEKLSKSGTYQYHIRAYGERGNMIKSKIISIEFIKN